MKFKFTHKQLVALREIIMICYHASIGYPEESMRKVLPQFRAFLHLSSEISYDYLLTLTKRIAKQKDGYSIKIPNKVIAVIMAFSESVVKLNEGNLVAAVTIEIVTTCEQQFNSPPKALHV